MGALNAGERTEVAEPAHVHLGPVVFLQFFQQVMVLFNTGFPIFLCFAQGEKAPELTG